MPAARRPARAPAGYTWDPTLKRYRDARGRIVARDTVRRAIDQTIAATEERAVILAEALKAGNISLGLWESEMRALVKDVHLYGAAAVRGGWDRLTPGDLGRIGQRVRTQYGYLEDFAADIASGKQPLNRFFVNRAGMYAQAGRATHEAFTLSDAKRVAEQAGGELEERNVLGDAHHCDECENLTGRGWVPAGSMPRPGNRTCLSRCHCRMERRLAGGGELPTHETTRTRKAKT